ncbi:AAC(3) family N-acetyltransferase [Kitasatospora sp. NBC_01560]|uniref:aminoglycoside N(3)-acetyltransferase n=1 Tax=Kitasatospora sp. NBC_01560 TaxID=2975965 RepID=UPI00386C25D5
MLIDVPLRTAVSAPSGIAPLGRAELADRFTGLGVGPGQVLLVHASLRALGPVEGGATVVEALLDALGGPERGTLVAFTASPENSITSRVVTTMTAGWSEDRMQAWRESLPPFDPLSTPASPTMGTLSELIRRHPGAVRSSHPQASFAAIGARAVDVTAVHDLECHLGERSPLGALYRLDARVLSIGAPMGTFTGFHLADVRAGIEEVRHYGCKVKDGDGSRWCYFDGPLLDDVQFEEVGAQVLARATGLTQGPVGGAPSRLIPMREAVDLATDVFRERRPR